MTDLQSLEPDAQLLVRHLLRLHLQETSRDTTAATATTENGSTAHHDHNQARCRHLRLKLLPQPLLETHQVHLHAVSSTQRSPRRSPHTFSSWIFDTSPRIFVICSSNPRFILSTSCTRRLTTRAQHSTATTRSATSGRGLGQPMCFDRHAPPASCPPSPETPAAAWSTWRRQRACNNSHTTAFLPHCAACGRSGGDDGATVALADTPDCLRLHPLQLLQLADGEAVQLAAAKLSHSDLHDV